MPLSEKEQKFINNRRKLIKFLPLGGWSCITILVTYLTWSYLKTPMLFNPFLVHEKILNKQIKQTTLELMSLMLPVAFSALFIVMIFLVAFMFAWNSLEKKYLKIIDQNEYLTSNTRSDHYRA